MKDIIWNQSATEDYHDNIDYLLKKWTEREALFFMDEVESLILISLNFHLLFDPPPAPPYRYGGEPG